MLGVEVNPSKLNSSPSGGVSDLFGDSFWFCEFASDVSADE